jgi:2,3-dihydroxybiphenyl 1,2-dioxygenase
MTKPFLAPNTDESAFGKVHLGYLVIETHKFDDWHRFGADAIGLQVDTVSPDAMRFRLDDHECRFLLQRGPAEDVAAAGWLIDDHETFDQITARVRDRGVPFTEGTAEEAALRGVERLLRFPGPKGMAQEIFSRPKLGPMPLDMTASGFVTGNCGLGHVAITTTRPDQLRNYYNAVFDARLTDWIDETITGVKLKIKFLRVNERHHSIAVANTQGLRIDPVRTRIQHLNVQVASLDDMAQSYRRLRQLGFTMALGVGQHTNDRELSYYVNTPSGFEWETGWNPITITGDDEANWRPTGYDGISIWGHTPMGHTIVTKLEQFRQAARHAVHSEETVAAISGG